MVEIEIAHGKDKLNEYEITLKTDGEILYRAVSSEVKISHPKIDILDEKSNCTVTTILSKQ